MSKATKPAKGRHPAIKQISSTDHATTEILPAAAEDAAATPAAPGLFRPTLHGAIRPDPANPRKVFDDDGLAELQASIVLDGLAEPLLLRPVEGEAGQFMLIAGERRWRAIGLAIAAGDWPADRPVDAMVREVDDRQARRLALVENLQRRDLNAIEQARALAAIAELDGVSAAQIGRDLGFTERWAQQRLSLLKLSPQMQERVAARTLKVEDAREAVVLIPKLPEIKRVELENGKISVAAAKAWLERQPKPLELSPAEWLVALEVFDKLSLSPIDDDEGRTYCLPPSQDDLAAIKSICDWPCYLIAAPRAVYEDGGYKSGLTCTGQSHNTLHHLKMKFGDDVLHAARRRALIEDMRKAAGVKEPALSRPAECYATAWLNCGAVPVPDPEIAASEAGRRAADQAATQARRDAEAEREARRDEAIAAAREIETAVVAVPAAVDPRLAAALQSLGVTLPVCVKLDGEVVDAEGRQVIHSGYHEQYVPPGLLAKNRLLALAMNAAAGLATPEWSPPAADTDAPSREDFVREVAGYLIEDCDDLPEDEAEQLFEATERASRGLDAYLAQERIEYGDDAYDWEDVGAMALAQGIRENGLGAQLDIEEAVAAAPVEDAAAEPTPAVEPEAEIPGYLRRLAGASAEQVAEAAE